MAQYNLGWLYANGNELNVDVKAAVEWWQKAAAQGHMDAQFAVGMAYTTGEGIRKDIREAMRWFVAAAVQGLEDAREIIVLVTDDPAIDVPQDFPELLQYEWYGRQGTIKNEAVNVRKAPGTDAPIVTKLRKGDPIRIIKQQEGWSLVVLTEEQKPASGISTGWIYGNLIRVRK